MEQELSEDLNIPEGSIKINGIELGEVTLLASNSSEQNTQLLMTAINAISDETGVTASISAGGSQLILQDATGEPFVISDSDGFAAKIGLETGSYRGKQTEVEGIFTQLDNYFEGLMDGDESTMGLLSGSLSDREDRLTEELQRILDRINARYETMATQFANYNSIISKMQASFNSLQMMIDQSSSDS